MLEKHGEHFMYFLKSILVKPNSLLSILKNITRRRMERRKAARVEAADMEAEEAPNCTFSNKVANSDTENEKVDRIE
jgi:hypothetical protein